jgi:hypothetical protein
MGYFSLSLPSACCAKTGSSNQKSGWVNNGGLHFSFMIAPQEHRGFKASG